MTDETMALDFDLAMAIVHRYESTSRLNALAEQGNPHAQAMLMT